MKSLVAELRRRNVLRVAAAYALVAWIIIEAGSVLLPTFGASERVFQVYVIAVIAGFVIAIVFAWIFEVTPDGVRLDRNVDRTSPVDPASGQKLNYALIALLVIALAVSITFNVTGIRDSEPGVAADIKSIAVLPFTSRSSDPENLLFSDGIHDDLLTRLANIKALKVISRTSVMEYRDTTRNLRQIAAELGVQAILEGAVQRIGDDVRINLQLIDARTDEHVWAKTFDRQLTMQNIFSIQSEVSESVAAALQATLSPDEQVRMAVIPTTDLRAYRLYKEAKNNLYKRLLETTRTAREQFQEAIALDPRYADAHAGLAEANLLLWINHADLSEEEATRAAQESIDNALALDPNLADAYAILGLMNSSQWSHTRIGTKNLDAEAAFRRAIALNPNHASAYMWFASLRDTEERLDEAIELYQKSMELDPLGRIPYSNLPMIYAKRGQSDEAMRLWLEAVRIHNDWPTIHEYIAIQLWGMGRLDEAYAWHEKAERLSGGIRIAGNMKLGVLAEIGEYDRARAELDSIPTSDPFYPLVGAFHVLLDGKFGEAHAQFADAIDSGRVPAKYIYKIAGDAALLSGNLESAKRWTLQANPILASDAEFTIDRYTARDVVRLAYIEQRQGNDETAFKLLSSVLELVESLPRLGTFGFGILDVQIYALLGRKEDALAALRDAIDQGFRGTIFFDSWTIDMDPYLESVRGDSRFQRMSDELDGYLRVMRDRLIQAEEASNLDSLRAKVEST